jgi:hypothetical protein
MTVQTDQIYQGVFGGSFVRNGEVLGTGQTAAVYPVRRVGDDGERFALKLLIDPSLKARFLEEVETLRLLANAGGNALSNPNGDPLIPQIFDYQESGPHVFIVMTLAQGQSLDAILRAEGRLSEAEALTILVAVARLFDLLHTRLHRSYLNWQPRNAFWDRERQSLLVLNWDMLSKEGQADVTGDIAVLGSMLYRMVVGVQPPAAGLSAAPGWAELTPGVQQILRTATHPDPAKRYRDAAELQDSCQRQLDLWRMDAAHLLLQASDLQEHLLAIAPTPDQVEGHQREKLIPLVEKAHNQVSILHARKRELGRSYLPIVEELTQKLTDYWQHHGSLMNRGRSLIHLGDISGARSIFEQALSEGVDDTEKLTAKRWQWVTQAKSDRAREIVQPICELLNGIQPQVALTKLQEAGELSGDPAIAALHSDAVAQVAWAAYLHLHAEAQEAGRADLILAKTEASLTKLRDVQAHVNQLDDVHALLLRHRFGDLAQTVDALEDRVEALQAADSRYTELATQVEQVSIGEAHALLKAALDEKPRYPRLVALVGKEAESRLRELTKYESRAGQLAPELPPIQNLLALGLLHSQGTAYGEALRANWHTAQAMIDLDRLLAAGLMTVADLRQIFARLDATAREELQDEMLLAAARHVMAEAAARIDPFLAAAVTAAAKDYLPHPVQKGLEQELRKIENQADEAERVRMQQQAEKRSEMMQRIRGLLALQRLELAEEAQTVLALGDRLLGHDPDWQRQRPALAREIEQEIDRLLGQSTAEAQRQELDAAIAEWERRLPEITEEKEVRRLSDALPILRQRAGEIAPEWISRIDQLGKDAQARINLMRQIERPLAAAQAAYTAYATLERTDPDLRTARFQKLDQARFHLQQASQGGARLPTLDQLGREIEAAWHAEGFEDHPANRDNPLAQEMGSLRQEVGTLQTRVAGVGQRVTSLPTQIEESVEQTLRRAPKGLPSWVAPLLILFALLVGLAVMRWMLHDALSTMQPGGEEAAVATLSGEIGDLRQQVTQLGSAVIAQPTVDLSALNGQIENLSAQVAVLSADSGAPSAEALAVAQATAEAGLIATATFLEESSRSLAEREETLSSAQSESTVIAYAVAAAIATREAELAAREAAITEREAAMNNSATESESASPDENQLQNSAEDSGSSERAAEDEPAAASAEATPTPTPIAIEQGQIAFSFPPAETELYVAPWQVVITANRWLTGAPFVTYRLTLENTQTTAGRVVLATFNRTLDGPDFWVYERNFAPEGDSFALFDGFPGLSDEDTGRLGLDANNQLPPGSYRLGLEAQVDGEWRPLPVERFFTILEGAPPTGTITVPLPLLRRSGPMQSDQYPADRASGLPPGTNTVSFLGRTEGFYANPNQSSTPDTWLLWQSIEGTPRRGWVAARFVSGITIEDLPVLAPPQPAG